MWVDFEEDRLPDLGDRDLDDRCDVDVVGEVADRGLESEAWIGWGEGFAQAWTSGAVSAWRTPRMRAAAGEGLTGWSARDRGARSAWNSAFRTRVEVENIEAMARERDGRCSDVWKAWRTLATSSAS